MFLKYMHFAKNNIHNCHDFYMKYKVSKNVIILKFTNLTFFIQLVVHVGVSQMATCLNIEKCAQRAGYERPDEDKSKPSCGKGCLCSLSTEETEDCIHTNIDVTKLCEEVNKLNSDVKTLVSDNAGR